MSGAAASALSGGRCCLADVFLTRLAHHSETESQRIHSEPRSLIFTLTWSVNLIRNACIVLTFVPFSLKRL